LFAVFLDFFCLSPTKTGWRQSLENRGTILVWISQQIIIRNTGVENLGVWTTNGL
jgi:hypothetical protein